MKARAPINRIKGGAAVDKEQISGTQVATLLFFFILSTEILFVPGITAQKMKQSAWLVPLVSSLMGFVTLWIVWKLNQRFPNQSLPEYSLHILGKFLGKGLSGTYVIFLLILNVLVIREFTEFIRNSLMPNTPSYVLCFALTLVGGFGAYKGIEVIARMAQFVLPLFVLSLLILLVFAIQYAELGNLFPFLEGGVKTLVIDSITPASWYGEIVILAMILPSMNKPAEVKRKGMLAILGVTLLLTLETFITTAVLGAYLPAHLMFPFWYLARYIEFGHFGIRIETLILILWITGIVTKVSLTHYLLSQTTAKTFGLQSYKKVVIFSGPVLLFGSQFIAHNTLELGTILEKVWPPFALTFELLFPLILLATAMLRKKRGRRAS